MKRVILGLCVLVLSLSGLVQASQEDDGGNVLVSKLWDKLDIPVCWENPDAMTTMQKLVVQDAIAESWEAVSLVRFTGWGACAASDDGIRIYVDDSNPRVRALGKSLDGMVNGMYLNNTYELWSPSCSWRKDYCNAVIAIHEFGHALGFAHEQNREDTPDSCDDSPQGTNGDVYVDEWDIDSVMNYCNPSWNNYGVLSETDKAMAAIFYGESVSGSAEEISVCNVTASSDDGNIAENTVDGDLTTRWSADGEGEVITFEFCNEALLDSVDLSWYKGDERSSQFRVEIQHLGLWWSTAVNGSFAVVESAGDTIDFEKYTLSGTEATGMRINGMGNTANTWNSLNEAKFYTPGGSSRGLADLDTPLAATIVAGETDITLEWSDNSVNEDGYLIEASIAGSGFMNLALLDENANSFVHSNLSESGSYSYRVSSYSGLLRGVPVTQTIAFTAPNESYQLNTPSYVDIDLVGSSAVLTWLDNSSGELGYFVEYKPETQSEFVEGTYLSANTETFTITDLTEGSYDIRISAYVEGERSDYLNLTVTINLQEPIDEITPASYQASSDDGNVVGNVFDENYGTRWSAQGEDEYIHIDLGAQHTVTDIQVAWYKGDERQTLYQLAISDDATTWTIANDSISTGDSLDLETIINAELAARYIRIIGLGNTSNDWNSITEVKIYGSLE